MGSTGASWFVTVIYLLAVALCPRPHISDLGSEVCSLSCTMAINKAMSSLPIVHFNTGKLVSKL